MMFFKQAFECQLTIKGAILNLEVMIIALRRTMRKNNYNEEEIP